MKIIRLTNDVLDYSKDEIRNVYDLDSKDTDSEIYRILVPIVENTDKLNSLVEAFVDSDIKVPFTEKYTFHCANPGIVYTIYNGIAEKGIKEYKDFQFPYIMNP